MYKYEEVYEASLAYFMGDDAVTRIWISKYCLKDQQGNYYEITPDDMHKRLAREFARIECRYSHSIVEEVIYNLLKNFKYIIPQGSPMAGIGNEFTMTSLSNCFVVDSPFDSYPGIIHTEQEMISIMKRRGGVGLSIHSLRPKDMPTTSVSEKSSGLVLFSERYSNATREVAQDGRRGALMLSCRVTHPDILQFIEAKVDTKKITGANVSIMIDDGFMEAVKSDTDYEVFFESTKGDIRQKLRARAVWDKIVINAWKSAEPGILFWDTILRESPADCYAEKGYRTIGTNPCFVGDSLILTSKGYKSFEELKWSGGKLYKERELPLFINENGEAVIGRVWSNGFKNVIRVTFDNLSYLECTPSHIFKLIDESECVANNLLGKIVKGFDNNHSKVTKIEVAGIREVFDFNLISDNHWGVVGGKIVHNCGELPLCEKDSCRLMVLNLYSYVKNPFTPQAEFDKGLFIDHVNIAQRLMDDMVDLEIEKVDAIIKKIANDDDPIHLKSIELNLWKGIRDKAVNGRRTGLGITGEGDMIAAMGLRYGSEEATRFAVDIHRTLAIESYKASVEMAEERGCFPIWDLQKEKQNPFISRLIESTLTGEDGLDYLSQENWIEKYMRVGRRNIANLTIAPAGTVSSLTNTTSGIEPCFLPVYKRRRKTNEKERSVFTDEKGDMWEEYKVIHPKFRIWYEINWERLGTHNYPIELMTDQEIEGLVSKSPYYKSCSNDVDWVSKVKMQGEVQKWIDHSISVTVNLPKEATVEIVDQVYRMAYESGCKGVTVYRDGSRSGILLSNKKEEENEIVYRDAPKRLEVLDADIYTKTALGKDWTVLVGLLKGKPFEIFAFEQLSQIQFPREIKRGKIKKVKGQHYQLIGERNGKEYMVDNIISLLKDDEKTQTRRYSLDLRHGIKPVWSVQQIDKYADITSFDKVISRVLKNYTNGEKSGDTCPLCHSKLIFEDGCEKCPNGDFSKCG